MPIVAMPTVAMPTVAMPTVIARLHAEAARCERIATGMSNPDLVARLSHWAAEYRTRALHLTGCPATTGPDRR